MHESSPTRSGRLTFAIYGLMVAAAVAAFFYIRSLGEGLDAAAPAAAAASVPVGQSINTIFHVLLALVVVIVTARGVGAIFGRIGQPPVIGEVIGGIMLGPSLLGRVAPDLFLVLLPPAVVPFLGVHAQIGIILYMFLIGLELDLGIVRKNGHATLAISHASIIVPFVLGSALSLWLYPLLSSSNVPFTVFALFIGVSLSVTAFPVLARILTDRGVSRSSMGMIALTCAAIDDATAWCLLALVVSAAQAQASSALLTVALTIAFVVVMLWGVAPVARRLVPRLDRPGGLTRGGVSAMLVGVLVAAMATEYIGIHGLFGAFLFGAIIPRGTRAAADVAHRLDDVVAILFLPAFFAFTGLRTEIGLISGAGNWLLCGVIILVACAGKFGGSFVASRLVGLRWRDSAALGILMNTRGLVELIVLNIGLDLQIISPTLFTMLVIMALVTTFITTPLLQLLLRKHPWVEIDRTDYHLRPSDSRGAGL